MSDEKLTVEEQRISAIQMRVLDLIDEMDVEVVEAILALLGAVGGLAEASERRAADIYAGALLAMVEDDIERARAAVDTAAAYVAIGEAVKDGRIPDRRKADWS